MLLRLQNGLASMRQLMQRQERVANNLANVNTAGYKRDRAFTEALGEHLDAEGAPRSQRRDIQWADLAGGPLEATGNPLDLAIDGDGFFVFAEEDGTPRYSRAASLVPDADGTLRDAAGHALEGDGGPIQIPENGGAIEIDGDGTVSVGGQRVGRVQVVRFETTDGLVRLDGAAFRAEGVEPEPVEAPSVRQGFVEGSNVDAVGAMTDMIATYRQFEAQQKMLQTTDQVLGALTRDLGKF